MALDQKVKNLCMGSSARAIKILLLLLVGISIIPSCFSDSNAGNPPHRVPQNVPEEAKRLNDSAVSLIIGTFGDSTNYAKALVLLRKAVSIDSNYYYGHYHKLMCENYFKMYDSALVTSLHLLRIRESLEHYSIVGVSYDKLGDSVKAADYYMQSLKITEAVLDTMTPNISTWPAAKMNEISVLILLNRKQESKEAIDEAVAAIQDTLCQNYFKGMKSLSRNDLIFYPEKIKDLGQQ